VLTAKEIRKQAKSHLSMTRMEMISSSLLVLLTGGVSAGCFVFTQVLLFIVSRGLHSGAFGTYSHIAKIVYIIIAIYFLISLFAGSFIELGYDRMMLSVSKGDPSPKGTLSGFKNMFFKVVSFRLYLSLKIIGWTFLLIIPGIYAVLNYSLAPFLMAQTPEMTPQRAVRISKVLMRGYQGTLFRVILGFLDEIIISILLLGIPFIYVIPRIKAAVACFFWERIRAHNSEIKGMLHM